MAMESNRGAKADATKKRRTPDVKMAMMIPLVLLLLLLLDDMVNFVWQWMLLLCFGKILVMGRLAWWLLVFALASDGDNVS